MKRRALFAALFLAACRESSVPVAAAGPAPALRHHDVKFAQLPAPFATKSAGNPPVVVAQPAGAQLHLPPGFKVSVYASELDDPRTMLLAPNGDVLLAEPGADKILVLRDANHDGVAEQRFVFASGLYEPFGLAIQGQWLYVGNSNAVVRLPYTPGQTQATAKPQHLVSLPE